MIDDPIGTVWNGRCTDHPDAYDALYAAKDYEREVTFTLDRFDAHGNSGNRALVVGCGIGRHSAVLEDRRFRVTGVDPNPAMLDRARERSDGRFPSGGLPALETRFEGDDPAFDLVWAPFTVLNYLAFDQLAPALESLTAVLTDGGVLVFDVGDFPEMRAPALQIASGADRDCARLYQFHRGGDRARMDALVFYGEEWFTDTHTLTVFDPTTIADSLRELGYTAETHDWYGDAPTVMSDPAVIVAY